MPDPTQPSASLPNLAKPALSKRSGVAMVVLTLLGWSSIPLFLKHFAPLIDCWTANGWRYALSALIWLPVLILGWKRKSLPPGLWKAALVPSLFNVPAQVAFGLAPYLVDPGLMTFSMRLQIVFVMTGAAILFAAERAIIRTPAFLVGMTVVLIGTAGTIYLNPKGLGGGTALGITFAIGAGLLYSGYALAVRKFMHGMAPLAAFAAISQYTAVSLFVLMLVFAKHEGKHDLGMQLFRLDHMQLLLLALSALIGIGLGHTLYFASIARLGLAVSAGVVQLQPVIVSIISISLFNEAFTPGQWAFGILAIAGAVYMLATQALAQRKPAANPAVAR